MKKSICVFFLFLQVSLWGNYALRNEPIDVVIPAIEKDLATLDLCIDGIKKNGQNIRRIIVISQKRLTYNAEWIPEDIFPFSKRDIAEEILPLDEIEPYMNHPKNRLGWIFQQLLKLYAPFVIEDISSNVLVLDADTIFLNPVEFLSREGGALFNPSAEYHLPYFFHAARLHKEIQKEYREFSGISHHMLFQKPILEDLFSLVEEAHGKKFYQAFCFCISKEELFGSCASEYEIYFNFALYKTNQVSIRVLKWANTAFLYDLEKFREGGFHYISCHEYMRKQHFAWLR